MARTIEVSFLGGPDAGKRPVEVTNSGRLPELIPQGIGTYNLSHSPTAWNGEYHYQKAEYRWSEG
jgi:hypothetical protein